MDGWVAGALNGSFPWLNQMDEALVRVDLCGGSDANLFGQNHRLVVCTHSAI